MSPQRVDRLVWTRAGGRVDGELTSAVIDPASPSVLTVTQAGVRGTVEGTRVALQPVAGGPGWSGTLGPTTLVLQSTNVTSPGTVSYVAGDDASYDSAVQDLDQVALGAQLAGAGTLAAARAAASAQAASARLAAAQASASTVAAHEAHAAAERDAAAKAATHHR